MHNFLQFLGDVMGQKLDHTTQYHGKRLFTNMYMDKLRNIINSIVVDRADKYTGKLIKGQEDKSDNKSGATKKKTSKKHSHHKQTKRNLFLMIQTWKKLRSSCSENENNFMTLTSSTGAAYHPPPKAST